MTTLQQDKYPMLRGSVQVFRVNIIQLVWTETLGYLLHPKIPQNVSKIADVGTATGLWLCELNAERARLQRSNYIKLNDYDVLDGFDISTQSFLPDDQKPSKIVLLAQDARGEVPPDLRGKYDVVHLRLITPGIYDGDPTMVIKHCRDLLRPGGYLQWEEFDLMEYEVVMKDHTEPNPSYLQQVVDSFQGGNPKGWIPKLPTFLQTHGFSIISVDRKREPEWHRTTMTHLICAVLHEVSRAKLDVHGPPGAGEKVRGIVQAALEENLNGSYISSLYQCVVAQKPE